MRSRRRRRDEGSGGLAGATARVENAAGDFDGSAVVRGALRRVDDAGGVGAQDALPGGEHIGAIAAPAQAAVRGIRGGEEAAVVGGDDAAEHAREGVGIPDEVWAVGGSAGGGGGSLRWQRAAGGVGGSKGSRGSKGGKGRRGGRRRSP